jgi:hypothetical protein
MPSILGCGPQTSASKNTKASSQSSVTSDTEATFIELKRGAAKGTTVDIPPGSLALGTDVSLSEVDSPEEFNVEGVDEASAAIEVSAVGADGQAVTELSAPMTIAIPYVSGASLMALAGVAKTGDNLCALLKSPSGLFLWRRSSLSIDEEKKKASFQSLNLGIFKLVYCGNETMDGFKDADAAGIGATSAVVTMKIDTLERK